MTSETLQKADIFSLGVMMYQLCSGRNIRESGEDGLYRKLREGKAETILGLKPGLNYLIQKCLHADHTRRPSARDILADKLLLQVSPSEKKLRAQLVQKDAAQEAACAKIAQLERKNAELMKENLAAAGRPTSAPPAAPPDPAAASSARRHGAKLARFNSAPAAAPSSRSAQPPAPAAATATGAVRFTRFAGSSGFAQPRERSRGSRSSPRADTSPRSSTSRGTRFVQALTTQNHDS